MKAAFSLRARLHSAGGGAAIVGMLGRIMSPDVATRPEDQECMPTGDSGLPVGHGRRADDLLALKRPSTDVSKWPVSDLRSTVASRPNLDVAPYLYRTFRTQRLKGHRA